MKSKFVILALLFSACATHHTVWYNDNGRVAASNKELVSDIQDCSKEASRPDLGLMGPDSTPRSVNFNPMVFKICMRARGWEYKEVKD
jgi:hypothetical protein